VLDLNKEYPTTEDVINMKLTNILLISCLTFCFGNVQAEDVYKWVDENGVTHYDDASRSVKNHGAETINIQTPKVGTVNTVNSSSYTPKRQNIRANFGNQNLNYQVSISSPSNGDEIRANNGTIYVVSSVNPKPQGNFTMRVFIDGSLYASANNTTRVEVPGVSRGEHTIITKLQTQDGKIIASNPVNVTVLRVSINNVH